MKMTVQYKISILLRKKLFIPKNKKRWLKIFPPLLFLKKERPYAYNTLQGVNMQLQGGEKELIL